MAKVWNPTPWECKTSPSNHVAVIVAANGEIIAQMAPGADQADAGLLVAAPELLDALELFLQCGRVDPATCEERAKAAIAKMENS